MILGSEERYLAMAGRRTKLTPQVQQTIVAAVQAGAPLETAYRYAGISISAGHKWRQRGERALARGDTSSLYVFFLQALTLARAQDELRRIARINKAGEGGTVTQRRTTKYKDGRVVTEEQFQPPDWRADAWHLERARPQEWGRQDRVNMEIIIRRIAEQVAAGSGVTADEVLAEAEAILREVDHGGGTA